MSVTAELLALATAVVVHCVVVGRSVGYLSASSLFLYAQVVMAVGILPLLSMSNSADRVHAQLLVATCIAYVAISCAVTLLYINRIKKPARARIANSEYPRTAVWALSILSIAIGTAYYIQIGYLAIWESFSSVIDGTKADLAALRLESYAGARYLFPGYVNQFKNALLPALVIVIVYSAYKERRPFRLLTTVVLTATTLVLLLGTGQRGAFIKVALLVILFLLIAAREKFKRHAFRIGILAVPIFMLSTIASGRAGKALANAPDVGSQFLILSDQLLFRFSGSGQLSAVVGFRYIYPQNIGIGSEWARGFIGLLPGQPGSDIANQIFRLLYGSSRGNSPLSIWGSAYYNFGFNGAVLLAATLGLLIALISSIPYKRATLNLLQAVGFSGIAATLGTWTSDGPTTLLNSGLVVYIGLFLWGCHERRRAPAETVDQPVRAEVRGLDT